MPRSFCKQDRARSRRRRRARPAVGDQPEADVDVDRMRAEQLGLSEGDVARSLQESLSGSFKVAPTFWINPKNGVAYPIVAQTPQYWLDSMSALENIPASQRATPRRSSAASRPIKRGVSPARRFPLRRAAGHRHLCDQRRAAISARVSATSARSSTRPRRTRRRARPSSCAARPRR